ncbi:MAG: hypothetical protein JWL59_4252 [Chthoniobacteraceae bacterium]|nr:hypothetical protein [Chthoniobacteraceae bacterium]
MVELLVSISMGVMISGLAFCLMQTGAPLLAKNISINYSHNSLRRSLDALGEGVQCSFYVPKLIDTTGAPAVSPAAGICFDRLVGDPYVITHPGGEGLSAAATSITLTFSADAIASPPLPKSGDVLIIDDAPDKLRPRVARVTGGAVEGAVKTVTITLDSALGTAISWDPAFSKGAKLVHREALIVMPNGARRELRHYRSFEPVPALNDVANYALISNQVGTSNSDITPFSIRTVGLDRWLDIDLRVRTSGFENRMAKQEFNEFSNFVRVQTMMTPRLRPQKITP